VIRKLEYKTMTRTN